MIIRQVYNHEYASIVETDSSYLFFGGRNIGAFKVGEELTAPCEPYKILMKWNISKAVENMIDGYLNENTHTVRIGKKRHYSDEQRAKMAERLKNAREKK